MLGFLAYLLGFSQIVKGSLAALLMRWAWKTGIGMGIISALQSAADLFYNDLPKSSFLPWL